MRWLSASSASGSWILDSPGQRKSRLCCHHLQIPFWLTKRKWNFQLTENDMWYVHRVHLLYTPCEPCQLLSGSLWVDFRAFSVVHQRWLRQPLGPATEKWRLSTAKVKSKRKLKTFVKFLSFIRSISRCQQQGVVSVVLLLRCLQSRSFFIVPQHSRSIATARFRKGLSRLCQWSIAALICWKKISPAVLNPVALTCSHLASNRLLSSFVFLTF